MEPIVVGALVFACTFGAALVGMQLRRALPEAHLSDDSRETVKVATALIATMTALILGLVTASAKSSFDALDAAVKQSAAEILTLDRTLARYGPETAPIRAALRNAVKERLDTTWPAGSAAPAARPDVVDVRGAEGLLEAIRALSPQNDQQRWLQARAVDQGESLLEERWAVFSSVGSSVPGPFLAILVFWLALTFASFGLFAPRNATVVAALLLCTLSVAGAIFLILEMDGGFQGLIRISADPLRYAYSRVGQ